MDTTVVILSIVILLLIIAASFSESKSYGLAKVLDKNTVDIDQYTLTVIFNDRQIKTKTIYVSQTVYYKFNPGDYITIKV